MDPNQITSSSNPPQQSTPKPATQGNPPIDLAESFAPMPSSNPDAFSSQSQSAPLPDPIPEPIILYEETIPAKKPPHEQHLPQDSNVIMPQRSAVSEIQPTSGPTLAQVPDPISQQVDTPTPAPVRTSMHENEVRGVNNPSPKDYGIIPETNRAGTPPAFPRTPQPPQRMTALDAMYQSALGAPLEGPVIPSTRPQLQGTSEEPGPHPFAQKVSTVHDIPGSHTPLSQLPQGALAVPPTPTEALRDLHAPEIISKTNEERTQEEARKSAIRTLEGDVSSTIAKNSLSISGIALAQQRKVAEEALEVLPEDKKFSWWAISGIALAVVGVGVIVVAFLMQSSVPETPAPIVTTQDALIPSVPETLLDITDMTRANTIRTLTELPKQYTSNSGISLIRLITYKEQVIEGKVMRVETDVSPEQFFAQISLRAPGRLARALGNQTFFGVINQQGHTIPFLVFEVISYDSAFAGMLEWERYLSDDLPFLSYIPPVPEPIKPSATSTPAKNFGTTSTSSLSFGTSSTSSLTSSATLATTSATKTPPTSTPIVETQTPAVILPEPAFTDVIIKNHDARVLRNSNKSTRILYAFPTKNILLIAQNDNALSAIIEHLNTARFIH